MERKVQLFLETLNSLVWWGKVKVIVLGGNLLMRFKAHLQWHIGESAKKEELIQNFRIFCEQYGLPYPRDV